MNIWQFMGDSPILTFLLAWSILSSVETLWKIPFLAMNIRKHGWPPAHCDADGDAVEREDA